MQWLKTLLTVKSPDESHKDRATPLYAEAANCDLKEVRRLANRATFTCLLIAIMAAVALSAQDLKSPEGPERLAATASGELARGETIELEATVIFMFRKDISSYLTLRPEAVDLLVSHPDVRVPRGLKAKIVQLHPFPTSVDDAMGRGEGYGVECKIEISASAEATPGAHEIVLGLVAISEIAKAIQAFSPLVPPGYVFRVKVWESKAARDEAKEQEKRRIEQQAAKERSDREAALAAEARAEKRQAVQVWSAVTGVILLLGVVLYVGPWLWPKYKLTVRPGRSATVSDTLKRERTIDKPSDDLVPEVLSDTRPARSFWGGRIGVTVATQAISTARTVKTWENKSYRDGTLVGTWYTYSAETTYTLSITGSACAEVPSGIYLARTKWGGCRVKVS